MGRFIKLISAIISFLLLMGTSLCFAQVPVTEGRTAVTNTLPDVTIYADTDMDYSINEDAIQVYVDGHKTDLQWAGTFKETREGAVYSFLIDVSGSISEADFQMVKKSILDFANNLSDKDRIYLIPFGESVYGESILYTPRTEELIKAVESLTAKDEHTQLYAAMDGVAELVGSKDVQKMQRKIAMVFTDGIDDTTGGLTTRDEAVARMKDAGIPLYAFAVGSDKEGKDLLGTIARSTGGAIYDFNQENCRSVLSQFRNIMERTITIKTKVRNSEGILDTFSIRVTKDGDEFLLKGDIRAHKTENSKDAIGVAIKKIFLTYWWAIAVVAIAVIALIVLLVIKHNKGVVNVDGKIVYASKVQRKYHIQAEAYHTKSIVMHVSINGSSAFEQPVDIVESIIVGRSDSCDVYFDDISISRQHFSIELIDGELFLRDLESTSGTYLNGIRVYAKQRLCDGDTINAGRASVKLKFK